MSSAAPTGDGTTLAAIGTPARGRDFPLYAGDPRRLTGVQWAVLLGAWLVAAACDLLVGVPGPPWLSIVVRGVLFAGLPLLALAWALGGLRAAWGTLFRRVRGRDVGLMVGFAVLNVVVTFLVGVLVSSLFEATPNPTGAALADLGTGDRIAYFLSMVPQLVGEEVFTVVPFLAVLTLATVAWRLGRRASVTVAVAVAAVLFALIHLPTYDWNLPQCLLIIGVARVVLFVPYLLTKNLAVSAGAHIINDWTLFGLGLLGAAAVG
ncbi:CPBP family glutamic-type intramembrane protease [Cellulosimicrobium sp. PMB13]|uniref:CPBP family glutamic-type intramembrane protease n=1 Tax=Cellulosimicrobium sp. PMB13 TaxID=3120158 RepID=UPI003F4C7A79